MAALKKGPAVPLPVATLIIGLLLGGGSGYYFRFFTEPAGSAGSPAAMGSKMSAGGTGGGGSLESKGPAGPGESAGGGAGASGRPTASPVRSLVQAVCGLDVLAEKGELSLGPEKAGRLLSLLKALEAAEALTPADCEARLKALEALLTAEERKAMREAGAPFGSGQGGGLNPEKPFSVGPPASRLKALIARLEPERR
jgi:hypothetical protein